MSIATSHAGSDDRSLPVFTETIRDWDQFWSMRERFAPTDSGPVWSFRGQTKDLPLRTTLERACKDWDVDLANARGVERQLIRDFRRQYDGQDQEMVASDTLYCLALMQHHGAPTRILDGTYSPFVAAYFALETASSAPVVWCINGSWCGKEAQRIVGHDYMERRNADEVRNDITFLPLYNDNVKTFICPENAFFFNRRLIIQQGMFFCPGNVSIPFEENLSALDGWQDKNCVTKLKFEMNTEKRERALAELYRMNVHRASLFPGLDGFAQSLKNRLPFYLRLARDHTGDARPNA